MERPVIIECRNCDWVIGAHIEDDRIFYYDRSFRDLYPEIWQEILKHHLKTREEVMKAYGHEDYNITFSESLLKGKNRPDGSLIANSYHGICSIFEFPDEA